MRILLVEDTHDLADAIVRLLGRVGHAVDWQCDGARAAELLEHETYDLIVLDIGLPRRDGLRILSDLRRRGDRTAVLMLTARAAIEDRVHALDVGADDYLAKPFDFREFEARCRVLLRRQQGLASGITRISNLTFDRGAQRVTIDEKPIDLPNREYRLLEIFIGRINKVVSKDEISRHLFAFDEETGPSAIEIYVSRLRKKLVGGPLTIRTLRGSGYIAETAAPVD
jgi:two-component system response regulator TctD